MVWQKNKTNRRTIRKIRQNNDQRISPYYPHEFMKIIKDNFNVDYSMNRVRATVHKLGYSYKKGLYCLFKDA
ncbi:MAG: Pseudogene of conserved hypothetical protein [Methanobrevibacter sp. CfCl-M3]